MIKNGIKRIKRFFGDLGRKMKAALMVSIIAIASIIGFVILDVPDVEPPAGSGDLNATDIGGAWQVDWLDHNDIRLRITIDQAGGTGGSVFDVDMWNLTQFPAGGGDDEYQISGSCDFNPFTETIGAPVIVENSTSMFQVRSQFNLTHASQNYSGYVYLTVFNNLPFVFTGAYINQVDYSADININNQPQAVHAFIIGAGSVWDNDGVAGGDTHYEGAAGTENFVYTYDADFPQAGTKYGLMRMVFGEKQASGEEGDNRTGLLYWERFYTGWNSKDILLRYHDLGKDGTLNFSIVDVIQNTTGAWSTAEADQFHMDYVATDKTLNSSVANDGTWYGWQPDFCAYRIEATGDIANVTFDGSAGVLYRPTIIVTNINVSAVIEVRNGSTKLTNGVDYHIHKNTTNDHCYVWFEEMNDAQQSIEIKKKGAVVDLSVNSPNDMQFVNGSTGNTIDWVVTDLTDLNGDYTVYMNDTHFNASTWTNLTNLAIDVDSLTIGYWNMTIDATDGAKNVTDTVFVTVAHGITFWINDMQLSDYLWGAKNLTYELNDDEWVVTDTNSYSTTAAVLALKSLSTADIINQSGVINGIQAWQNSQGEFDSIGRRNMKFWDQYWCVIALDALGALPDNDTGLVDWINAQQTVETNEVYWALYGSDRPGSLTQDRFSQTFSAVMAIISLSNADTTNVTNWNKVKTWIDSRQNADGGWDATNTSESNIAITGMPGEFFGNLSWVPYTWMACEVYNASGLNIPNNASTISWLRSVQSEDGGWGYHTGDNSTNMWTTYAAIRALDMLGSAPANTTSAKEFIESCQGDVGFGHRPRLIEILESTYYAVESLKILGEDVPDDGVQPSWVPDTPTPSDSVQIYEWTYASHGVMEDDSPSGVIAEVYNLLGYDFIAPKMQPPSYAIQEEIQEYANNNSIDMSVARYYEDYPTTALFEGIPEYYTHAHEWVMNSSHSPDTDETNWYADHVDIMVDEILDNRGIVGKGIGNMIDTFKHDYNWTQDPHRTGQVQVLVGHFHYPDPWAAKGFNPAFERYMGNMTPATVQDAHGALFGGGMYHNYRSRAFFIAPNNTMEGLLWAIERGWTAVMYLHGDNPSRKEIWNPDPIYMFGPENIVDWIVVNLTSWKFWGAGNPVMQTYVYALSNGTKNYYDYDNKATNETSTWFNVRDGGLFRVYNVPDSTIQWISLGTEKWTSNITPTVFYANWSDDDPDYRDYRWFEDTSLPMGEWQVKVGYKILATPGYIENYTWNIGAIPAPFVSIRTGSNRTIDNTSVISLDISTSPDSSIVSVQYKWDGNPYSFVGSPYNITVVALAVGGHTLTIRVSDGNYTEEYPFYYDAVASPVISGVWVGNKSIWDEDSIPRWYDIHPSFPPSDGNVMIYALLDGQAAPRVCYEKRYAQYPFIFNESNVVMTDRGLFDDLFNLWVANITDVAPGMNVTYWVMLDDTTNSSDKWFKAYPDPFQSYYGLGLLSSWGEDDWSVSALLDSFDEVSASMVIPINMWGTTSENKYRYPFNSSWVYYPEDGTHQTSAQDLDEWISELNTRDPNGTRYTFTLFFYHRSFRDESPLNVPAPRTQEEWDAFVDKYIAILASDPSFIGVVLDQEYASYHETEGLYNLYQTWDDDGDGTQQSDEWNEGIVQTFLDPFREFRWVQYGGQPHMTYRWSGQDIPDRANIEGSVNHFQHADYNGGYPNYFRQINYAIAGHTIGGSQDPWTPGLFTMGISPSADDLATDYQLHWTNETHGTSTEWTEFGFADQLLYAVLLNPRYVTLWVQGKWYSGAEPYDFDDEEKSFANKSAKLLNTVSYVSNLTYTYRPIGNNLSVLSSSELGTKPPWMTDNATAADGTFYSIMKETGSMYQVVAMNLWNETRTINFTIGDDLFTEYGTTKLVSFNASDGSGWTLLNKTNGQRDFQIQMVNSSFQIWKVGVPFEVLGLPFDYDGWNFTALSNYPSISNMSVISYDWDTLDVNVSSNLSQFFKFYVPSGHGWSLTINGVPYAPGDVISMSSAPAMLGLLGAGAGAGPNTDPSVNSPVDQEWINGTLGHEIDWIVTDPEEANGDYTVYKNTSYHGSGIWANGVQLNYNINNLGYGYWNMTITATDGQGGVNATDMVMVNVTANLTFTPSLNPPGVTVLNVTGNIEDFPVNITPTGQTAGSAIFKIDWQAGADYQHGAIDVNFSSIPGSVIFYVDDDNDFLSGVSWNNADATTAKEVIDYTAATDPDYLWMEVYMPANQGGFSFTVYFWSREDD